MSASLLLIHCLLIAAQIGPQASSRAEVPKVWHVGSYASELGARWSTDGTLDTGAALFQLVDGQTGAPVVAHQADFGPGPTLGVRWRAQLGELRLSGFVIAGDVARKGDRRLVAAQQVAVHNPTDTTRRVSLEVQVRPGASQGDERPLPTLAFEPGQAWVLEDGLVSRDGQALIGWVGTPPLVEVLPAPEEPFALAARLRYELELPPGVEARLEFTAAGAPAGEVLAEADWRKRFATSTWGRFSDERRWEWEKHGQFGGIITADPRVREAMICALHVLRSFGRAQGDITALSDRPFGHPASDAAAEAQILGLMFEYGFKDIGLAYLDAHLDALHDRAAGLPLERKVAYLHGLARAVRLAVHTDRHEPLAEAIVQLIDGGGPEGWSEDWQDGAVAVDPWLHPESVRRDLEQILERAGRAREQRLPSLAWADSGDQPVLAHTRALLEAVQTQDDATAGAHFARLLDRTTKRGAGCLEDGGLADAVFAQCLAAAAREVLIGDHGDDLVLFPGVDAGLMNDRLNLDTAWMPTRFGLVKAQMFHSGKRLVGGWVRRRGDLTPARELMAFPATVQLRKVKPHPDGGTAEVLDEGLVRFEQTPPLIKGVRFTVRAVKDGVDLEAGGAESGG